MNLFSDNLKHCNSNLQRIAEMVYESKRISEDDAVLLYESADLGYLGVLANFIREQKHGSLTFFNRNFHIEPTNVCVFNCQFCSYRRKKGEEQAWENTINDIREQCKPYKNQAITEVHIVGGVHPDHNLEYYCKMLEAVKEELPQVQIKAFSAIELDVMFRKANVSAEVGLQRLKHSGLDTLPGGGAEIFDSELRQKICPDKADANRWLEIHEAAHKMNIPTNATILYGHIESYRHRVEHMSRLRQLQDKTLGFNAFIPLKFRKENNQMSQIGEVSVIEDLKNYAISRIFLDNFAHIKAYWVMIGKQTAQLSLDFGVDDLDGTVDDTTKIYSMAGVTEQRAALSTNDLVSLITQAKRTPVERDSFYNAIKVF